MLYTIFQGLEVLLTAVVGSMTTGDISAPLQKHFSGSRRQ